MEPASKVSVPVRVTRTVVNSWESDLLPPPTVTAAVESFPVMLPTQVNVVLSYSERKRIPESMRALLPDATINPAVEFASPVVDPVMAERVLT